MVRESSSLRRPPPSLLQRRSFLVLHDESAGGYLTYIKHVLDHHQLTMRVPGDEAQGAVERVTLAARVKNESRAKAARVDEAWCVFEGLTEDDLSEARIVAAKLGIAVASVYPTFDLWLLLHFVETPRDSSAEGVRDELAEHLPSSAGLAPLADRFDLAADRAQRLQPGTAVHSQLHPLVSSVRASLEAFGGKPRGLL
jgi:hypothetical protein